MKYYLVLITWPNGVESLVVQKSGTVEIADTLEKGVREFEKAIEDLSDYAAHLHGAKMPGLAIRLVEFERLETVKLYNYEPLRIFRVK